MRTLYLLFVIAAVGLVGCQQEEAASDKGMREAMDGTKKVTADELPDNVPQWVKDQVKAGEQRQGGGAAPPPSAAGK